MKPNLTSSISDDTPAPKAAKAVKKCFVANREIFPEGQMGLKEYRNEGWHMTFANGCTISVQFGSGTYSDQGMTTAEVAAWNAKGNWLYWTDTNSWVTLHKNDSDVMSNVTTDQIAIMIRELIDLK